MNKKMYLFMIVCASLLVIACANGESEFEEGTDEIESVSVSGEAPHEVTIINNDGEEIGQAFLSDTNEGVNMRLHVDGLEPGVKAMHFHEVGACETPTFESAGDHYNPFAEEHGFDNPDGHHAGDLPNIEVNEDGSVNIEVIAPDVVLRSGEPNSLLDEDGSALIIHYGADDYKTNPSGNAGDRVACGAIVQAN